MREALILAGALAAGLLAGAAIEHVRVANAMLATAPAPSRAALSSGNIMDRLKLGRSGIPLVYESLGLTPFQRTRISAIITRSKPTTDSLLRAASPVLGVQLDSVGQEIERELMADQWVRLKSYRRGAPLADPGPSAGCPVTIPNGSQPPAVALRNPEFAGQRNARAETTPPRPDAAFHGNGMIWTTVPSHNGRWVIEPETDGSLSTKVPWYLAAPGRLSITGHRVDMPSDTLVSAVSDAVGMPLFHPSGLQFASPGCWQITARANGSALTLVFDVSAFAR